MAGVAAVEQSIVQAFTAKVVADVIANSQVEFLGDGLDASVLRELETRWKSKLSAMVNQVDKEPASGATQAARVVAPAAVPVAKAQARAKQAPVLKQAPAPPLPAAGAAMEPLALLGRPLPQLPLSGWIVDAPQTEPEPAAPPQAVEASRKRKEPEVAVTVAASPVPAAPPSATHPRGEEAAGGPAAAAGSCAAATPAEEPPLDSDDDEKDPVTANLVLTQFEKVSHVKNKWKCLLRNGVLTLNGTEYVFNSATGTFTF